MEQDLLFLHPAAMVDDGMNTSSSCSSTYQQQPQRHGRHLRLQGIRSTATMDRPAPSSQLLGVRKTPAKPWRKPAADPPAPPKVYRVEPRGFRQLVQKLTGAGAPPPPPQQRTPPPPPPSPVSAGRFGDAAPAPLELGSGRPPAQRQQQALAASHDDQFLLADQYTSLLSTSPVSAGVQLSPSQFSAYLSWDSHPALSPGALAPPEKGAVL